METITGKIREVSELGPPKTKVDMHVIHMEGDMWSKGYSKFGKCPAATKSLMEKQCEVDLNWEWDASKQYRNIHKIERTRETPETVKPVFKEAADITSEDDSMDGFVIEANALMDKFKEAGTFNDLGDFAKIFATYQMSDHKRKQKNGYNKKIGIR